MNTLKLITLALACTIAVAEAEAALDKSKNSKEIDTKITVRAQNEPDNEFIAKKGSVELEDFQSLGKK